MDNLFIVRCKTLALVDFNAIIDYLCINNNTANPGLVHGIAH